MLKFVYNLKLSCNFYCSRTPAEPPVTPSHQLPEDPEVITKEIRKYESLLEATHSQFKSGKKLSKKHEEQLWELQRTLTQLKVNCNKFYACCCK